MCSYNIHSAARIVKCDVVGVDEGEAGIGVVDYGCVYGIGTAYIWYDCGMVNGTFYMILALLAKVQRAQICIYNFIYAINV